MPIYCCESSEKSCGVSETYIYYDISFSTIHESWCPNKLVIKRPPETFSLLTAFRKLNFRLQVKDLHPCYRVIKVSWRGIMELYCKMFWRASAWGKIVTEQSDGQSPDYQKILNEKTPTSLLERNLPRKSVRPAGELQADRHTRKHLQHPTTESNYCNSKLLMSPDYSLYRF